jgi:hypothetical protein
MAEVSPSFDGLDARVAYRPNKGMVMVVECIALGSCS